MIQDWNFLSKFEVCELIRIDTKAAKMGIGIYETIGYAASVIIAISMAMSSIVRFRLINLAGASLFIVYGILIGAIPVALLNFFIVSVDIYYLRKIFSKKEVFETMQVRNDNKYLQRFLEFHAGEIERFFPGFTYRPDLNTHSFFILRDMAIAGLFLARKEEDGTLYVALDYVIPEYRDFKNGKFIFHRLGSKMLADGIKRVVTRGHTSLHQKYLKKLGFNKVSGEHYELRLTE